MERLKKHSSRNFRSTPLLPHENAQHQLHWSTNIQNLVESVQGSQSSHIALARAVENRQVNTSSFIIFVISCPHWEYRRLEPWKGPYEMHPYSGKGSTLSGTAMIPRFRRASPSEFTASVSLATVTFDSY